MKSNRNTVLKNLDFSKTILMILVVLYHSMVFFGGNWFNQLPIYNSKFFGIFSQILNSFHIYAFVLISGYVYAYLRFEKDKYLMFNSILESKFKRLIVPYIFISIFWVIPFHIYYFKGTFKEIIVKYFLGCAPSQLWFLLMLFNVFIISFFIGEKVYSSYFKGIFYSLLIYVFGLVLRKVFPNLYQVTTACTFFIYFTLGMLLYKNDLYFFKKVPSYIYILVFAILQFLKYNLFLTLPNSYIYINKIVDLGLDFSIHIVGAIMAFVILQRVASKLRENGYNYEKCKTYNFLKEYNFIIYLLHQQIIYCVIDVLNRKVSPGVLVISSFFISLLLSSIIIIMLRKINVVRRILNI